MPTISSVGPIAVDPNSVLTGDGTVCHPLGVEPDGTIGTIVNIPFDPANFHADGGGAWTVLPQNYNCQYYISGKQVTIALYIVSCTITPANTVRAVRFILPKEINNIPTLGGISSFGNTKTIFVGSALVSDVIPINFTFPVLSAIANTIPPFPVALSIAPVTSNWPAPGPSGVFGIVASCTYFIQ